MYSKMIESYILLRGRGLNPPALHIKCMDRDASKTAFGISRPNVVLSVVVNSVTGNIILTVSDI